MTATVTKLNSKLPVVSKIAFCTAAGKDMATKIYTGENGKFTRKVGFKQNSKTYPFQIQYRQRSRYTNANAQSAGAQWTNWTGWKNAVAVSGIPIETPESTSPVNRWLKANKGVNKKGTYQTFFTMTNYLIPSNYDARQFQFRIRTINKAKAKHGNWTTQTISAYKRAEVLDETYITASDGGLKVKFNYKWDRTASIVVNSIKDSQGRELLKKSFTTGVQVANLTNQTTPTPRTGYSAGMVVIPIGKLKRKINSSEVITTDIRFTTADGAPTVFSGGTVIEPTRNIGMNITYTWDEVKGVLIVSAEKTDSTALVNIGCNISYTYNGKAYAIGAFKEDIDLTDTSLFYFYPPIGIPVNINVKEEDASDFKDVETPITVTLNASGYRLNKKDNSNICGIAWGNADYSIQSTPKFETDLPYGRDKNIIFYGEGTETEMSLNATIVDKDGCYGGASAKKAAWDEVKNNQGIYYFRTNKGDLYEVGVIGANITHNTKDFYELSVNMVEVV